MAVGIPGSGKTTYLKPYAQQTQAAYICADDIRQEILGDPSDQTQNARIWEIVYARAQQALQSGSVVIDGIGTDPAYRRNDVRRFRPLADQVIAFWFDTPLDVCLERNRTRERQVNAAFVRRAYRQLQVHPPSLAEGFDEIRIIKS